MSGYKMIQNQTENLQDRNTAKYGSNGKIKGTFWRVKISQRTVFWRPEDRRMHSDPILNNIEASKWLWTFGNFEKNPLHFFLWGAVEISTGQNFQKIWILQTILKNPSLYVFAIKTLVAALKSIVGLLKMHFEHIFGKKIWEHAIFGARYIGEKSKICKN